MATEKRREKGIRTVWKKKNIYYGETNKRKGVSACEVRENHGGGSGCDHQGFCYYHTGFFG